MNTYVTSHTLLTRAMDHEDSEAWEVFVERYHRYIYKLLDKLGVKEEKDDVSQEVMLTIWKKLDTYDRERSKFRTWLSSVIRLPLKPIPKMYTKAIVAEIIFSIREVDCS